MKDFTVYLSEQEKQINELIKKIDIRLKNDTTNIENISYSKRKKGYQYYFVKSNNHREYIAKKNLDVVRRIFQRQYYLEARKALLRERSLLEHFLKHYNYPAVKAVYEKLSDARKTMITPVYLPDEEYITEWRKRFAGNINSHPIENPYLTDNGELVRSKSEKILADLFKRLGIPYYYEPKLETDNGKKLYPDFALLCIKTRKTIYWEHFGLTNDGKYASKSLKKLDIYEKNGLYVGKDILFSVESTDIPLDIKQIEKKLKEYVI